MALTKGQKRVRNSEGVEAKTVSDPKRIKELWTSRYNYWSLGSFLRRSDIWKQILELQRENPQVMEEHHLKILAEENSAISDSELVELGVARRTPLYVLKNPNCGDECLAIVAELWETGESSNMDCVPNWATEEQIQRMYELRPSCEDNNQTVGYAQFLSRFED